MNAFTIAQVAAKTNVTAHTLRYYERIGLIQSVNRAGSGHRRYRDEDIRWIEFLRKLHATGMPIRRMLAYASLQRNPESTLAERRKLLEEHRADVTARIEELRTHLAVIDKKVQMYEAQERQSLRDSQERIARTL